MMDYYSDQPGPTKEAAIKEIVKEIGQEERVREIMTTEVIGSWTGWYFSHKREIIERILKEENNKEKEKNSSIKQNK